LRDWWGNRKRGRQGDKGTRGQGDKGTRGQGDKETRGQGDKEKYQEKRPEIKNYSNFTRSNLKRFL
jgi:hypothetical protein